jgi:REP element-mobilizing transposase RayT
MRQSRIKIPPSEGEAVYHCVTRTVNGEWLFDGPAMEILRRQIWLVADFCGVDVVTYAILSNHFHVLVRVPQAATPSDAELVRRYRALYPKPTKYQSERLDVIEAQLRKNGNEAVAWRNRQLALMGDVSQYMKLVKQRFSIWFNRAHGRFGTLWAERFKSVLVEARGEALKAMAAYIDLNCVRAGLARDPKDYRFCGYAEAVAGNEAARKGINFVMGPGPWDDIQPHYRELVLGIAAGPRTNSASISPEDVRRILGEGGQLPLPVVLRCRVRYFIDGAVLGSQAFVRMHLERYRKKTAPHLVPAWTDWGDLATLRGLRRNVLG